jgi:hypothetical protein
MKKKILTNQTLSHLHRQRILMIFWVQELSKFQEPPHQEGAGQLHRHYAR